MQIPIVGYNCWWGIKGVQVNHPELQQLLKNHGFDQFMPEPVSDLVALRRALQAWKKDRLRKTGASARSEQRTLVRPINKRLTKYAVFALVGEQADFDLLGLTYGTQARIMLEKIDVAERASREPRLICTTEAEGLAEAVQEAAQLTSELRPLWKAAQSVYMANDVTRMLTDILTSIPSAITIRQRGGVYFVPQSEEQRLFSMKAVIESLPYAGYDPPYCVTLPVIDEQRARAELARAVHAGFIGELAACAKDLEDLQGKAKQVSPETIEARLNKYQHVRARAKTHADLLNMQTERIEEEIVALNAKAAAVLKGEATDTNSIGPDEEDDF